MKQTVKWIFFLISLIFTGIGYPVAMQLMTLGAKVYGVARNAEQMAHMETAVREAFIKSDLFTPLIVDLTDWKKTREIFQTKIDQKLDGIVNAAGLSFKSYLAELTEAEYDSVMDINFKAVFNVVQLLAQRLNKDASIVNMSSFAAQCGCKDHVTYGASMAALEQFTRTIALEMAPQKIRCNAVAPTVAQVGVTNRSPWTDNPKASDEAREREPQMLEVVRERTPGKELTTVKHVVEPVIFLLSQYSEFINGITLPVDGGFSAAI